MDIPPESAAPLMPGYVLPEQFTHTADSPQKALMRAVLVRAVDDLTGRFMDSRPPCAPTAQERS